MYKCKKINRLLSYTLEQFEINCTKKLTEQTDRNQWCLIKKGMKSKHLWSCLWNWILLTGHTGRNGLLCPNTRKPASTRMYRACCLLKPHPPCSGAASGTVTEQHFCSQTNKTIWFCSLDKKWTKNFFFFFLNLKLSQEPFSSIHLGCKDILTHCDLSSVDCVISALFGNNLPQFGSASLSPKLPKIPGRFWGRSHVYY